MISFPFPGLMTKEPDADGIAFFKLCGLEDGSMSELFESLCNSRANNTFKAYIPWVKSWQKWVASKPKNAPLTVSIASFLCAIKSKKSVPTATAALKLFFSLATGPVNNPMSSNLITLVNASARRASKNTQHKTAFSKCKVQALLNHLYKRPTLANSRLAAMIALCFFGALRISECINLNLNDVSISKSEIVLTLRNAKTDRDRHGQECVLAKGTGATGPGSALMKYLKTGKLELSSAERGALFRNVHFSGGSHSLTKRRVAGSTARDQLKSLLAEMRMSSQNYSWHSFRSGAASEALRSGVDRDLVRAHGRWRSDEGIAPYIDKSQAERSAVSKALLCD